MNGFGSVTKFIMYAVDRAGSNNIIKVNVTTQVDLFYKMILYVMSAQGSFAPPGKIVALALELLGKTGRVDGGPGSFPGLTTGISFVEAFMGFHVSEAWKRPFHTKLFNLPEQRLKKLQVQCTSLTHKDLPDQHHLTVEHCRLLAEFAKILFSGDDLHEARGPGALFYKSVEGREEGCTSADPNNASFNLSMP